MALDERQGLEDGVVHARGDLGALLAADPRGPLGVALEREPPEPRPADHQERAGDGARSEDGRIRAPAGQEEHGAGGGDRKSRVGHRRVGAEAPAAAPGERKTDGDQGDPADRAVGEADGVEKERACDHQRQHEQPDGV